MESNLLLEQYSWYKKQQLAKAPFECLLNADIEPNPHQVNAFCAAIQALKTGGIILADEVGLGKTIEAGLVLNYVLDNGAKKVLISLPATLRKQWEVELLEKFGRQAVILDRYTVEHDLANVQTHLGNADEVSIVIASYDYSSKLIKRFPHPKYGKEPISIGFWVGGTVTPNTFKELEEAPEDPAKTRIARSKKNSIYKQLLTCPFCGKPLTEENFYIDIPTKSVSIYCSDDKCMFYSLEKFVAFENKSKLTNAKKLLKAKNSPVLQMKKNDLLENLKKHSRYKTMFKFEEDHIVISSQKEAAAFIKMLNDDIVRSELTGKEYDSSSKMLLGPVGASH